MDNISDEQQIVELNIRNKYLYRNINNMLKLISEFRDEISDNKDIIDKLCDHDWKYDYMMFNYDERPKYCTKCFLER